MERKASRSRWGDWPGAADGVEVDRIGKVIVVGRERPGLKAQGYQTTPGEPGWKRRARSVLARPGGAAAAGQDAILPYKEERDMSRQSRGCGYGIRFLESVDEPGGGGGE